MTLSDEFTYIFKPLNIGRLEAKNRIEVSPACPYLATVDGLVTDDLIRYTSSLARSGAAIVTIGDSPVTPEYADYYRYAVNLSHPQVGHGLFKLSDAIHRYDALASIELNLRTEQEPADYTEQEIRSIIDYFAIAAKRAIDGGFDMVMLHGGHCHTIAQFYSPHFNKRTDRYGATTFENRCRFATELIAAVREEIGSNHAIEYRISGDDMLGPEIGVGVEEVLRFSQAIQDGIDMLHVSAGSLYDDAAIQYMIQGSYMPRATNRHLAAYLHKYLDIPVASVGSYNIELAEQTLKEGSADMIAMIRPFLADQDQLLKAKKGETSTIRPCLRCNRCAGDGPHALCAKPLRCSVNAPVGRSPFFDTIDKADTSKHVVVVGGGCAGLEAARRLAERGHKPLVLEQMETLGGTLKIAGANKLKADVKKYAEWSVNSVLGNPNIEVKTGVEVTPELLEQISPDAVVIAVGSEPNIPPIPGIDSPHVFLAEEIDKDPLLATGACLVIGAGLTGCETALMLVREGKDVSVINRQTKEQRLSSGESVRSIHLMLEREGCRVRYGLDMKSIDESGVIVQKGDGSQEKIACDTVILSLGVRQRRELVESLKDVCDETYIVGDCRMRAGNIATAVQQAFYAAVNI